MTTITLESSEYSNQNRQVLWQGVSIAEGNRFQSFIINEVASRLYDEEGTTEFETHLRGLASTEFARDNLREILNAEIPEERDWAIGEAMAEAYLTLKHNITWPWN